MPSSSARRYSLPKDPPPTRTALHRAAHRPITFGGVKWPEFVRAQPELASYGQRLLAESHGYVFLATVARDGAPRVHPIAPILSHAGLFVAIAASSPKAADLERDPRIALHSSVVPPSDEEFWLRGEVSRIEGESARESAVVGQESGAELSDAMALWEVTLTEAGWSQWVDGRPVRLRWRSDRPGWP